MFISGHWTWEVQLWICTVVCCLKDAYRSTPRISLKGPNGRASALFLPCRPLFPASLSFTCSMDVATNQGLHPLYGQTRTTHGAPKWCFPSCFGHTKRLNHASGDHSTGLPNWNADWSPAKKTWSPGSRGYHLAASCTNEYADFASIVFLMIFGHPIFSPHDS